MYRPFISMVAMAIVLLGSPLIAEESERSNHLAEFASPSAAVVVSMQKVHAGFEGEDSRIAQFGDSITHSLAFWSPLSWDAPEKYLVADDLPKTPDGKRWRDTIVGARDKGKEFANFSGWRVGQLKSTTGAVLKRDKPVAAIIMIGTNDISGGEVPKNYRADLESVVEQCLDAHCIPILNTIPPRRERNEAVAATNEIIRDIAKEKHLPLVDYYAACLQLRPEGSWQDTLIAADGVHPTAGKTNEYSEENLKISGYALRNWLNFLMVRELYFRVCEK